MQPMPTYDYFLQASGCSFRLYLAPEHSLDVELQHVEQRVPMNTRYECFSLLFRMPEGLALPQALYQLHGPDGGNWELLLTPVRPDAEGRPCLEAVFHREKALA